MAQQLRVFVSHSHHDNEFCFAIVQALRTAGADVWFDEHNLGWGQLKDEIIREMGSRPIFVLILSKNAIASKWVKREADWAEELIDRDPSRVFLPVTAAQIERTDFGTDNGWLAYYGYKRIEAPGFNPYHIEEAANHLLRALALTPVGEAPTPVNPQASESADDLITRGRALTAQSKYAEALPLFERATQLAPGSFDAFANLGYTFIQLDRGEKALPALERATTLDPDSVIAWYNKGWALDEIQRYEEALAAYDRALALDPNYTDAWNNKGMALYNLGDLDKALIAYERALNLDENFAIAWYNKGTVLENQKRYEEALSAYERGFDPNDVRDWSGKARCLRALGRNAEAEEADRRVKELGG